MSTFFRPVIIPPIPNYPAFGVQQNTQKCFMIVGKDSDDQSGTAIVPHDVLYAFPTFEKQGSIIDALACRMNTSVGAPFSFCRVGIYTDLGTSRLPSRLLLDVGELDTSNGGVNYWQAAPLPYAIPSTGIYWFLWITKHDRSMQTTGVTPNKMLGYGDWPVHQVGNVLYPMMCMSTPLVYPLFMPAAAPALTVFGSMGPCPVLFESYAKIGK